MVYKNIFTELTLPNGSRINNRIAKSAMSENMATKSHAPSKEIIRLYKVWAKSGAGLLITGNIMIDMKAIGEPRNVVVEDRKHFSLLKEWAATTDGTETHLWAQINHPGRQAIEEINKELYAPSAVPPIPIGRKKASKKIPKALTEIEIWETIERFGNTAEILKDAGFSGIQIHGAHGYLVSQFLSPYTNKRTDKWGGSIENRARFVIEIYNHLRKRLGDDYPIGIKLNSADFQKGGFTEEESMKVVKTLSEKGFDLIEISGGTYEAPVMMGSQKESTRKREAYFIDYVEKVRKLTNTPLMLTGGFRTAQAMESAIKTGAVDLVGIARPFCVYPYLTNDILTGKKDVFHVEHKETGIAPIDATLALIWYEYQLKLIGKGKNPNEKLNPYKVFYHTIKLVVLKMINKNKP